MNKCPAPFSFLPPFLPRACFGWISALPTLPRGVGSRHCPREINFKTHCDAGKSLPYHKRTRKGWWGVPRGECSTLQRSNNEPNYVPNGGYVAERAGSPPEVFYMGFRSEEKPLVASPSPKEVAGSPYEGQYKDEYQFVTD